MAVVLTVKDLAKAYKVYPQPSARLLEWCLPFAGPQHTLEWILNDINFSLMAGEVVGISGTNGVGKSTLLKIILGTVRPTRGRVTVAGRVAGMLDLGLGFHPQLTGRQNLYLAGQLLGLSLGDMRALLPSIINFSELGEVIDRPLRVYSSGMRLRLGFAISTAVRPSVFVVDEVFSVGDEQFQAKCFDRIDQFQKQGTAMLLVSHDAATVARHCDRTFELREGLLHADPLSSALPSH